MWANVQARMESAIEQRRKEVGGFWYDEEVALGQDDGEETIGGLDEVFMNIAKSGSNQARRVPCSSHSRWCSFTESRQLMPTSSRSE